MAKKKRKVTKKKKNSTNKILNYFLFTVVGVSIIIALILLGYNFGYEDANSNQTLEYKVLPPQTTTEENKTHKKPIEKQLKEVLKQNKPLYNSASHELDAEQIPKAVIKKIVKKSSKPKLAIIIDDVSTRSHIRNITKLNLPLTMSFLPPSKAHPNSAKLAAKEKFYMVHLPMEAMHFNAPEPLTLKVNYSQAKISERIKTLKKLFPRVKYINNHTGSKFTSDERAMNKLIYALNKNNIYFIDSRTTAKTKVPKVMKNFGYKYMSRDIFLDHKNEKEYVLGQIKKAVKIAKNMVQL